MAVIMADIEILWPFIAYIGRLLAEKLNYLFMPGFIHTDFMRALVNESGHNAESNLHE